ncbi:hypothetical protein HFD88_008406 [Aspergillus terreus]|nr:hypothetical protein HFD88_008406 [Aspergillus terreus]
MRPDGNSALPANPACTLTVASGLHEITPMIEAIRTLFQAPSFSIGVVYHGETIYTQGFGHADEESGRVPDEDTVYTIASCTKGFTGTAVGLLVNEGKLDFDEKVAHYTPSFFTRNNPAVSQQMTVRDMLSHCSGLSPLPYEVVGKNGSVFARREDVIQICNHLPRESEFRSEWKYNNWMFALAGVLIQQTSQQTFGRLVQREVFDVLGMSHTACENPNVDDNYARPYLAFSDGSKQLIHLPDLSDGWAFDASGRRISPLSSDPKQAYAMGLFTFQLPTTEMNLVTNTDVIISTPRWPHLTHFTVVYGNATTCEQWLFDRDPRSEVKNYEHERPYEGLVEDWPDPVFRQNRTFLWISSGLSLLQFSANYTVRASHLECPETTAVPQAEHWFRYLRTSNLVQWVGFSEFHPTEEVLDTWRDVGKSHGLEQMKFENMGFVSCPSLLIRDYGDIDFLDEFKTEENGYTLWDEA